MKDNFALRNHQASGVKSLRRALDLIEALSEAGEARLGELAAAVGLHESSARRLLLTLMERGYVAQERGRGGTYRLTLRTLEVGSRPLNRSGLPDASRPIMEEIGRVTGESVHLGVLDLTEVVYVERVDSPHSLLLRARVGGRVPLHSTAIGKAILAYLDEPERQEILGRLELARETNRTILDAGALRAELAGVRCRGFALTEGEHTSGVRGVAAPIFDYRGRVAAALSVAGPAVRLTDETVAEVATLVTTAARRISGNLGWAGRKPAG